MTVTWIGLSKVKKRLDIIHLSPCSGNVTGLNQQSVYSYASEGVEPWSYLPGDFSVQSTALRQGKTCTSFNSMKPSDRHSQIFLA